ncbi:DUF2948 family protein [Aliiroseovarius sp.]|uniref:DUF2948 family protein n=1 Tax=Aliiroseovarius sp. TaxID=1872442 RepID=UPI00261D4B71|nr:DUF2948 family protein [Aliiroseovarius sp.]
MVEDARFEDGGEEPLRLMAVDADDLQVVSSLVQDAVFPITEMAWHPGQRRFALLLNRFRWEDKPAADHRGRAVERVQSTLVIGDVEKVQSQGVDRSDKDMVLSLLSISFVPGEDGTGRVELTLAGDGAIALEVEALDVTLRDVTRPYIAPSKHTPEHPE